MLGVSHPLGLHVCFEKNDSNHCSVAEDGLGDTAGQPPVIKQSVFLLSWSTISTRLGHHLHSPVLIPFNALGDVFTVTLSNHYVLEDNYSISFYCIMLIWASAAFSFLLTCFVYLTVVPITLKEVISHPMRWWCHLSYDYLFVLFLWQLGVLGRSQTSGKHPMKWQNINPIYLRPTDINELSQAYHISTSHIPLLREAKNWPKNHITPVDGSFFIMKA